MNLNALASSLIKKYGPSLRALGISDDEIVRFLMECAKTELRQHRQ